MQARKWNSENCDLKVFGCVAYAHYKEGKLNHRAKKCLFLGYPSGTKGYRLWCLEKGEEKCIISRDHVVFYETKIPLQSTPTNEFENVQHQVLKLTLINLTKLKLLMSMRNLISSLNKSI